MSTDLKAAAVEYLHQRRARGYKLRDEGALLMSFTETLHARASIRSPSPMPWCSPNTILRSAGQPMPGASESSGHSPSGSERRTLLPRR